MNRKHQISDYVNTYEKLQKINPKIKFSSDFIIAYPGEDEKDFNLRDQLLIDSLTALKDPDSEAWVRTAEACALTAGVMGGLGYLATS